MTRVGVLDDGMWTRIEPLLPPLKGAMGRYRTGIAWPALPAAFGPWQTVWKRHHRFAVDGTWDRVPQAQADAADWRVSVDTTVVRVHQHGATAARRSWAP